jgi:hypothetical protein
MKRAIRKRTKGLEDRVIHDGVGAMEPPTAPAARGSFFSRFQPILLALAINGAILISFWSVPMLISFIVCTLIVLALVGCAALFGGWDVRASVSMSQAVAFIALSFVLCSIALSGNFYSLWNDFADRWP